jgi:hypothetical protein
MSFDLHENSVDKSMILPTGPSHEKDVSETEEQAVSEPEDVPPPPPDGGLTAWLQVLGSFFLFFNSW